ncbi:MAG: YkgJ family cysteine cluster protein [Candidatus Brocadiae bacterium]|nr:YkgJ family cysteine cluster protein [Candidatus Brocadiia bacterium]
MAQENLCTLCDGKCCRYFALEIDEPTTERDFDDIRWYLAHEDIVVFVEEGDWYLEVRNVCRHLDEQNRCRIYGDRPALCRDHATDNCEGRDDCELDREHEFRSDEEIAQFAEEHLARLKAMSKKERKKAKKGKKGRKGKKRE